MHRVRTKRDNPRTRHTWRERAFVFGGIAVAGGATALGAPIGAGEDILAPVWLGAFAWTVLASIAHVLWRDLRRGDWSAFREFEPPGMDHDTFDWSTRTGAYTYMRLAEQDEQLMRGNPY